MKNFLVSGIKNPLAPFILLLALIILMTIIISNINTARETAHAGRRSLLFDPQPEETDEIAGMSAGSEPDIRRLTAEALDAWEGGDLAAAVHALVSESGCGQSELEQAMKVLEEKHLEAEEYDLYDPYG